MLNLGDDKELINEQSRQLREHARKALERHRMLLERAHFRQLREEARAHRSRSAVPGPEAEEVRMSLQAALDAIVDACLRRLFPLPPSEPIPQQILDVLWSEGASSHAGRRYKALLMHTEFSGKRHTGGRGSTPG